MTFDELVADVMSRLNLTSEDARQRIGRRVNERHRKVTSSVGLITSRRLEIDLAIDPDDVDSILPDFEVTTMEKVLRISREGDGGGVTPLVQRTYDDLANMEVRSGTPQQWAVKSMESGLVIIRLDGFPDEEFTLTIEGYAISSSLSDDNEPVFPADFHDILIEGAMSDELRKMEKPQLAMMAEQKYMERLSDLRMFIAKSGYLDIVQGKSYTGFRPYSYNTDWPR
jgi:hypothetical protein